MPAPQHILPSKDKDAAAPLDYEFRRDAARLVFRRLILDPLFS
jgi:hypothetical protein